MLALPFAVTDFVRSAMQTGGYVALGGLTLVENLFPPIPSEIVLPLAGFYVGRGELTFIGALLASTLGSVIGALILYAAGRYGGRRVLERLGGPALRRGDAFFRDHGAKVVLFGRLLPGLRSVVSVPAGATHMPLALFVVLTTIGSAIWNAALIGAGWALGSNWDQVGDFVGPAGRVVLVAAVLAGGAAALFAWRRHRAATAGASADS